MSKLGNLVSTRGWLIIAIWILLNGWVAWLVTNGVFLEHHIASQDLQHVEGYFYKVRLPERHLFTSPTKTDRAESRLLEDGQASVRGKAHREKLISIGMGRYRHLDGMLWLSSSDNSDPRANGRHYSLVSRGRLPSEVLMLSALWPLLLLLPSRLVRLLSLLQIETRARRFLRSRRMVRTTLWLLLVVNGVVVWLVVVGARIEYHISPEQMEVSEGLSYQVQLPERHLIVRSDSRLDPRLSESVLRENDRPIGPAHGNLQSIASIGMGKYSHWQGTLFFSTSDNSDPRTNGRHYSLVSRGRLPKESLILSACALLPFLAAGLYRWTARRFPRIDPSTRTEHTTTPSRYALRGSVWGGIAFAGVVICSTTSNVAFWLGATATVVGGIYLFANLFSLTIAVLGRESKLVASHPLAFIVLSIGVFAMLFEGTLGYLERSARDRVQAAKYEANASTSDAGDLAESARTDSPLLHPEAAAMKASRRGVLTLPESWQRRPVEIPGSHHSYYWHEVLHVHDQHSFRRTTPFPQKSEGVYRIMVIGDSITYGQGVDSRWIYPTLIDEQLSRDFSVEVLNLGASGRQSEDILLILKKFLPELKPDLVIYGVCHNDFLPSGIGQYSKAYLFPIPESWKEFFLGRSRVANFVSEAYDVIARAVGLRANFYDDILHNFEGYQERFADDVKAMNDLVEAHQLPAIVAMVLDQVPTVARTPYQVTQTAERLLEAARMRVIPTEDYYRRFEGNKFMVSQWEGHPDEEAHAVFAGMFLEQIRTEASLQSYRRSP